MDAHGYGKRFIVRADEQLTAFLDLESVIRDCRNFLDRAGEIFTRFATLNGSRIKVEDFLPAKFFDLSDPSNHWNSKKRIGQQK